MANGTKRLEQTLHDQIPPTRAMGIEVVSYDGEELVLRAPLGPNSNDEGTAFAGSLYSLAVLAGWGMVFLKLVEANLAAKAMVYESSTSYRKPVREDIEARCRVPHPGAFDDLFASFRENGKGKIELQAEIRSGSDVAVAFTGRYAVRA